MPHIETPEGISIRYDDRGPVEEPAAGPPIVLAHGFTVTLEMWMPQMEALSERHRLITWDARGHGGSSAPGETESYTMPSLARDLHELLRALDVDRAIVGGMSFGGQIALQYAVEHPDRVEALVLSDSTTSGPPQPEQSERPRGGMAFDFAGDPGLEGGMHAMRTRPDLTPQLGFLKDVPTLVMFGDRDEMILGGVQRLIDGLPRRRVVRRADCTHGTSGQRPRAWNDAVLSFIEDARAGSELGEDATV
jgi:pimeloyl-ACP methyl ester carboxylesterase